MTRLSVCSLGVSCNEMIDTPMLLVVGVKGHAGMSPRQNFGRWWGKPKRVPIKPKTTLPHGEKSSRKAFKRWKKALPTRKT